MKSTIANRATYHGANRATISSLQAAAKWDFAKIAATKHHIGAQSARTLVVARIHAMRGARCTFAMIAMRTTVRRALNKVLLSLNNVLL